MITTSLLGSGKYVLVHHAQSGEYAVIGGSAFRMHKDIVEALGVPVEVLGGGWAQIDDVTHIIELSGESQKYGPVRDLAQAVALLSSAYPDYRVRGE